MEITNNNKKWVNKHKNEYKEKKKMNSYLSTRGHQKQREQKKCLQED